jgi:fluoride exporter
VGKGVAECLLVGVGGFVGANARYIVGGWVQRKWGPGFPYGTLVINVTGCFILGLFGALVPRLVWAEGWRLLVSVGFVGAYTTFSTFEYETLRLLVEGRRCRAAAANVLASVVLGFVSACLGAVAGRALAAFGWLP